jgi:hypothetical protein
LTFAKQLYKDFVWDKDAPHQAAAAPRGHAAAERNEEKNKWGEIGVQRHRCGIRLMGDLICKHILVINLVSIKITTRSL